jgi:hypothetical protein
VLPIHDSMAQPIGFVTFGAMAAELTVPPRVHFAPGPPHATPFVEVRTAKT